MRIITFPAKVTRFMLLLLLMADLSYSFYQHYHMSLGGDMSEIIVPTTEAGYYDVLHDPLGLGVLLRNEEYSTPNRFFAHWTASAYFKNVPLFLQNFVEPIDSVYLSVAIAKILIQFMIIYLLSVYISSRLNILSLEFLIAAAIIFPLFQTSGYNRYMGIIDQSVMYAIFYAFSLGLLMLFYLPFFRNIYNNGKPRIRIAGFILLTLLTVVLPLNGPLIPGLVLIICPMVLLISILKNYSLSDMDPGLRRAIHAVMKIPGYILVYFIMISFFCLYSLYIGQNDTMSMDQFIPVAERYARLPVGIYYVLTSKLGFPLLFLSIIFNVIIIRKHYKSEAASKLLILMKWIGIFAILYLLLLPLGGFRVYRENIVRYDTFMPVTLGIMFAFGASTFYLIKNMAGKSRISYVSGVVMLLLIYTNSDRLETKQYECERNALETLAQSSDKIVLLNNDCPVMEWILMTDYRRRELDAELLYLWNITDEKKLFYQKVE